jgi:hypothetical protein
MLNFRITAIEQHLLCDFFNCTHITPCGFSAQRFAALSPKGILTRGRASANFIIQKNAQVQNRFFSTARIPSVQPLALAQYPAGAHCAAVMGYALLGGYRLAKSM